jgi:hypothetical protein
MAKRDIKNQNADFHGKKVTEEDQESDISETRERESKEKSIYVKVSDETREIIDSYKHEGKTISSIIEEAIKIYNDLYSISPEVQAILENYKTESRSKIKNMEEAIIVLNSDKNHLRSEELSLWCRARDEMKMMLIGETTFNQLLTAAETPKESLAKPQKRNIAFDTILWYTGKPIRNLSLEEIVNAIQKMWIVANYFYFIDVKKESVDQYHIIFKHHQNKRYSIYWFGYFKELFDSEDLSFKCVVEGEEFDETLSLTVKKLHDKMS